MACGTSPKGTLTITLSPCCVDRDLNAGERGNLLAQIAVEFARQPSPSSYCAFIRRALRQADLTLVPGALRQFGRKGVTKSCRRPLNKPGEVAKERRL